MTTLTSNLSLTENITTIIRPPYFYISGFIGIPHIKYYYVFLSLVYIITLVGNTIIMVVICMARILHSPMYIAVFNLAFTDICESTALVPKLLDMFLFDRQYISYDQCLLNLFFVVIFHFMQSFNLTILSYDRLVAICCPLRYHMLVNHRSMFQLTGAAWVLAVFIILIFVGLITRLSFCGSVEINSYFCDPYPLYSLAAPCSDVLPTHDRHRAIKTCTSHLILVAIFYLPISIINIFSFMPTNMRIINFSLTSVLPPMLNPIIYVLKTEEFKVSIKRLLRRGAQRAVGTVKST
ncbi:olfactory receptor 1509 isoform X2 [Esox lucius]|uniref:olfactory receptor 1509 isoform X2 n=1 Tax=Esox lucius TaxID=8010 RepID=UPI000661DF33|nr:olfactory receptor 1509 isoform X2 [Esox lucius]